LPEAPSRRRARLACSDGPHPTSFVEAARLGHG
jgi:hypothetical protein